MAAEEPSYGTVDLTARIMPAVGQTHLEASNLFKFYWPNTITKYSSEDGDGWGISYTCLHPPHPRSPSSGHWMEKDPAADQRKPGGAPSNERNKKNGHGAPWRR